MVVALSCFSAIPARGAEQQAKPTGEAIYKQQCRSCHGERGEGVTGEYEKALLGNLSIGALTRRIEQTMPEGDADACVGKDAEAVAAYIYNAFYSPAAQAALKQAARPDLARLTTPQFRQSVADLVGSFRKDWGRDFGDERALQVRFNGRHPAKKQNNKKIWVDHRERVRQVRLDFAEGVPYSDLDLAEKLTVTWSGSLIAPETGRYDLVVRSPNGVKLWINRAGAEDVPLIDAFVVSGLGVREESQSVFLLGGRPYAFRLDWVRAPKEKTAAVELLWKTPQGYLCPVPAEAMLPKAYPAVTVVANPFPADDASQGYERGTGISSAWYEAVSQAAVEVAGQVAAELNELADTGTSDKDRDAKLRQFCEEFASRAMRRPLNDRLREQFVDRHFQQAASPEQAVKRVVLMTLMSPSFLYPEAGDAAPDDYDLAARLALYLWDSLPDETLLAAAERGELADRQSLRTHAERMLNDPRARLKLHGFFHHWLELSRAEMVAKDAKTFPAFSEELFASLRTSLDLFLDEVVWSDASDYRQLLQADYLYLNGPLRQVYGGAEAEEEADAEDGDNEFAKVRREDGRRSGVLTHPYLLTTLAYHNSTSPIHRGVFLTRQILGRELKPPPNAIEFDHAKFDPKMTMREKVTNFTSAQTCMACHGTINPLGFSLEHFDGIGRWQTQDKQQPIVTSSDFKDDAGRQVRIAQAADVAALAVESPLARQAFVRQLFQHVTKQDTSAYGPAVLDTLEAGFRKSNFHIRDLFATIAVTAATRGLTSPGAASAAADTPSSANSARP